MVNSLPVNDRNSRIYFVQEGQKNELQARTNRTGKWGKARDLSLLADVSIQFQVPLKNIKYYLGATNDVLPIPQNLSQWVGECALGKIKP